jgi:hypothetical protein
MLVRALSDQITDTQQRARERAQPRTGQDLALRSLHVYSNHSMTERIRALKPTPLAITLRCRQGTPVFGSPLPHLGIHVCANADFSRLEVAEILRKEDIGLVACARAQMPLAAVQTKFIRERGAHACFWKSSICV